MARCTRYPALAGKIAEYGIDKKRIAAELQITPRALRNKMIGVSEFTWSEVLRIQTKFFPEIGVEELMRQSNNGEIPAA